MTLAITGSYKNHLDGHTKGSLYQAENKPLSFSDIQNILNQPDCESSVSQDFQDGISNLRDKNILLQYLLPSIKTDRTAKALRHKLIKYLSRVWIKNTNSTEKAIEQQEEDLLMLTPYLCKTLREHAVVEPKLFCKVMKQTQHFILEDIYNVIDKASAVIHLFELLVSLFSEQDRWYKSFLISKLSNRIHNIDLESNTMTLARDLVVEFPSLSLSLHLQDVMMIPSFIHQLLDKMKEPKEFIILSPLLINLLEGDDTYSNTRRDIVALAENYLDTFMDWLKISFECSDVPLLCLQVNVVQLYWVLVVHDNVIKDISSRLETLFALMISRPNSDILHSFVTQIVLYVLEEMSFVVSIDARLSIIKFLVGQLYDSSAENSFKSYPAHLKEWLIVLLEQYPTLVQMKAHIPSDLWEKLNHM